MTDLHRLPPDQRAVLSLVLERGRSYGEVAEMLAIPESAVRDRAHAALDALASDSPSGGREAYAGESAAGESRTPTTARARAVSRTGTGAGARQPGGATGLDALEASSGSTPPHGRDPRATRTTAGSRRAGALLLAAIVIVIVVVVILLSSGGGKSSGHTPKTASNTTSSSKSSTKPTLDKTITLTSTEPSLKANGVAYVLSESGRRAFYVAAQNLPPSSGFFYAVWLYNSTSSSTPLGRAPTVGSNGRMEGGGPLPTNAADYHQLIITRETSTHPSKPGPVVLSGSFGVH